LSRLPSVEIVDVELDRNEFLIQYDPASVAVEKMLQVIAKEGFEGKVVPSK
jgi:hypothetical protein